METEYKTLEVGDYLIGEICIERKSVVGETPVFLKVNGKSMILEIKEVFEIFKNDKTVVIEALSYDFKKKESGWYKVLDVTKHNTNVIFNIRFSPKSVTKHEGLEITSGQNVWVQFRNNITVQIPSDELKDCDNLFTIKNVIRETSLPSFITFLENRRNEMKTKKGFDVNGNFYRIHSSERWHKIPDLYSLGFFFGLWIGDGWFTHPDRKYSSAVSISQKGIKRNAEIDKVLKDTGLHYYYYKDHFVVSSTAFAGFMKSLDFKTGAASKEIPPFVFDAPIQFKKDFIRGMYFADGWMTERQIKYLSKSRKLIVGLSILLTELEIGHIVTDFIYNSKTEKYKKYNGSKYYVINITEPIKFVNIVGEVPTKNITLAKDVSKPKYNSYPWRRIFNIEKEEKPIEVYDLTVEYVENFLGGLNPVLLHNTMADYIQSLISGRLSSQLYHLSTECPISAIVTEGYVPDATQFLSVHRHAHLSSLAGSFIKRSPDGVHGVISFFMFDTPYDTALFLKYCHDKVESGEPRLPKITNKGISSDDRLVNILTGFPYIGEINAAKLLKRFGTISSVSCADLKSLKEVLGEKRAESVFAWFHAPY